MTETYVAPIVAQQYEVNRAKCLDQGGCPSAEQMGSLICQQTSACGADPVEAAKNLNDLVNLAAGGGGGFAGKRRRSLLQFEGLVDLVGEGGGGAFPEDAVEVDDALAEAASPCTGCKKLATQVFKEAENGAPDKRWVEAMIRVHGREWCVRQSASVLPEYDPWQTYRGITSWAQVGNTPADANYMKANGIPKFGGANAMKSKDTDANTQWPPQDALRNASGYNPFVSNATGNRNGTFDNSTFVDPPVNEALMEILLENSPQLACPMRKADKQAKFKALQNGKTWPPPAGPPPSWAKHCVKNATVATYGFVGDVSVNSRTSLEFAILLPAFVMFSIMLINSASELYFVETPITFAGIVVLGLVLADNWRAVHNMVHCMDRVFLVLNIVHMSILAGAMLAESGGDASTPVCSSFATLFLFFAALAPAIAATQAEVSVAVANVVVWGSCAMLAAPHLAHSLLGKCSEAAGMWLGLAVHDTAQVMGAGLTYTQAYDDERAFKSATVTKLMRNMALAFAVPALAASHLAKGSFVKGSTGMTSKAIPFFLKAFVGMAVLRTCGDAYHATLADESRGERWRDAMSALGDTFGAKVRLLLFAYGRLE